jgi:cell division protein FtsQ
VRLGLPFCIAWFVAGIYFAQSDNRSKTVTAWHQARAQLETRPEFMVNVMAIDGASDATAAAIREVLPIDLPVSSFDLDLEAMRQTVESLDAVKIASLAVRRGNMLQIDVYERVPAVVWRHHEGMELRDDTGHRVADVEDRNAYPLLPLIAGMGAQNHVAEALQVMAAAAPIAGRVQGLVRMGQRRWDVVLQTGLRIMLPVDEPLTALERVVILDRTRDILNRDVVAVDMRLPHRPTVRLGDVAHEDIREINEIEFGGQL